MRAFLLLILLAVVCWGVSRGVTTATLLGRPALAVRIEEAFGTWKLTPARSTFGSELRPKSLTMRIEPHAKGEVFTLDQIDADGRATTASTVLYLDGQPRNSHDAECSGTQSSRRVDSRTVEILRQCASGAWTRFVRRLAAQPKELILEIIEQQPDGRRFEKRLVLEKQ